MPQLSTVGGTGGGDQVTFTGGRLSQGMLNSGALHTAVITGPGTPSAVSGLVCPTFRCQCPQAGVFRPAAARLLSPHAHQAQVAGHHHFFQVRTLERWQGGRKNLMGRARRPHGMEVTDRERPPSQRDPGVTVSIRGEKHRPASGGMDELSM